MKILVSVIQHLQISFIGVSIAVLAGVVSGIMLTRYKAAANYVMSLTDIIQTIPDLALLTLLMMVFGLGDTTVIAALFLYSLLPIVRNTYVGISGVDKGLLEAGTGMGMTKLQLLFKVELPMALPVIISGIRIAFITALGIATIGVLIGAGGLGAFIWRGIQMRDSIMILSGAIPISLLAIGSDFLLLLAEKRLVKRARKA